MIFKYEIPQHLEAYLGDFDEKSLTKLTTMLFEFAVNHRMLDYPKLHIEKQVTGISDAMSLLLSQSEKQYKGLAEIVKELSNKLDTMTVARIESSLPRSVISEELEILEDGDGEEDFFKEIAVVAKDNNGTPADDYDLADDLIG